MSENTPTPGIRPARRRRALFAVGGGLGILVAAAAAASMVSALALADQPGRVLEVPAVTVELGTRPAAGTPVGSPSPAATSGPAELPGTPGEDSGSSSGSGSSGSGSSSPGAEPEPELIPAPAPVVVDDHGGSDASKDDAGHDGGSDGTSGSSGSSGSGSSGDGTSGGKD